MDRFIDGALSTATGGIAACVANFRAVEVIDFRSASEVAPEVADVIMEFVNNAIT